MTFLFDNNETQSMAEINLMCLPRELRDLIYAYILPKHIRSAQPSCRVSWKFANINGILLVNHQLRSESLEAFYRNLSQATIVAPSDACVPSLTLPTYARLRNKIQNFVFQWMYGRRKTQTFSLKPTSSGETGRYLSRVIRSLPALQWVTCEITREPRESST
ncbi:hypothetical protein GQ44DRAFT_278120 [Phaeosphaeriaceae sp. PMI808]|nr:hypothetical protein GQ44DRAFT_278120 [Phaeosphaeriaceae sp. PMI808]